MSRTVNIHEAKTHLSRLVAEVAAGDEIVIARAGKPVARLVPLAAALLPKTLGLLEGKVRAGEAVLAFPETVKSAVVTFVPIVVA